MENKETKFKSILSEYQDMIYRLCCIYVDDAECRKDLYQNILMRIWKGLNSFENRSSISTWIYRISVNTSIDYLRKENNKKHISNLKDMRDLELADNSNTLEEDLITSEKIRLMYRCINKMTFIDKTLITLYLEDLSYREISEILGISEKNVGVRLSRIKTKLNQCLKDV